MVVSGEGRGENQKSPKDKVGEVCDKSASPPISSQQDIVIKKDINTSLVASSQKDALLKRVPNRDYTSRGKGTLKPKFNPLKLSRD